MSKKQVFIFLIFIIAIAAFLRLYKLQSFPPGLYPDEAMNGNNALEALETGGFSAQGGPASGWKWFYPENNGREALFINIQALSVAVFGNEPWALRGVSAIVGILTVLGLFFLTRVLLGNDRTALFASFFLAASFWHVMFSRIGFRAIMAPFFLVWSFYFLFKIINQNMEKSDFLRKSDFLNAVLGGLLFGLGFHTYISYRAAPLLLIFPFTILLKNKKIIALFLLFTFLAALPLGIYFLWHPHDFMGRTSQVSVFSSASPLKDLGLNILKTVGMFFVWGDNNWRHNLPPSPELWWPVSVLFLLGMAAGLVSVIKNFKSPYSFLFFWLALMLLPAIISNEGIPHALRSIVAVPPVFIFVGVGMEAFYQQIKSRVIWTNLKILIFLLLAAIVINTYSKYFFDWAPKIQTYDAFSGRYLQIGRYLNSLPPDIPKYVIINVDGVDVRGLPMPSQTVMFITDTFLPAGQKAKNLTYLTATQITLIKCGNSCKIATLEINPELRQKIKDEIPGLSLDINPGVEILTK